MGRARRRRVKAIPITVFLPSLVLAFVLGVWLAEIWPALARPKPWSAENVQHASVQISAVRSDGPGVICDLMVSVVPNGNGSILVDTYPLQGFDFQYSHWIAVEVAAARANVTLDDDGVGLKGADVIFKVTTPDWMEVEVHAIDGPSAGAAAAVATIAALENRRVHNDVMITGTIRRDGRIGSVSGILEKAEAASKAGASLFLVPRGQSVVTTYRFVEIWRGFYTLRPETIDLNRYAESQGWNMRIREVSTIDEALRLMLE